MFTCATRPEWRCASPKYKHPNGLHARLVFGCGCPIYAKLLIRHPDSAIPPFEFNSSLAKLGVREKLAAEELIDQWTVQFLSGQSAKVDPGTFKTVEQAIQDHLDEKRGTLDRSKESTEHMCSQREQRQHHPIDFIPIVVHRISLIRPDFIIAPRFLAQWSTIG